MKNLSLKYIPFGLLCAYGIKSLITGAGINEVLLIGIMASLIGFYESAINKKDVKKLQDQIDESIKINKDQINQLLESKKIQDKNIDDLKSSIVSVKVSAGIRGLTK